MKHFLLIGADQHNSTDGVIVQGIRNILTGVFGNEYSTDYLFIDDHNDMNVDSLYNTRLYDAVIVCGTPWLWDGFHTTPKFRNMMAVFATHNEAKKVFMGVGTCLNLRDVKSNILERTTEQEALRVAYSDAIVIVRDSLAKYKLEKAGVQATHLPCPAYFCYGNNTPDSQKTYNVLVWTDPEKTISHGDWSNPDKLRKYYEIVQFFYENYEPIVVCAREEEIDKALAIGLPKPRLLEGWKDTLALMTNANYVLSGRVHCAVPAFAQGAAVGLLPLDSRSLVLKDFGCPMIEDVNSLNALKLEHRSLEAYNQYRKLLENL
jgi:hypothetical protein